MSRFSLIKVLLPAVLVLILTGRAAATNTLYVQDAAAGPGKGLTIYVGVTNSDNFNSIQFDLLFPPVLTWTTDAVRLTSRATGHSLSASLVEPGKLRVLAWSLSNTNFSGGSGAVVEIDFQTGDEPGSYPLSLANTTLGGTNGNIINGLTMGTFTLQAPAISISQPLIDWGRVPLLSESFKTLTIKNAGNTDLTISNLNFADSRFSTALSSPFTLTAGASQAVSIRFYSAVKGTISSKLTISSNDQSGSTICDLKVLAFAVNEIHIGTVAGRSGYEVEVPVTINNMEPATAFQIKIKLPAVAKFIKGSESLSLSRKSDHILVADTTKDILTLLAYSPTNTPFLLNEGLVCDFRLLTEGRGGRYQLVCQDPVISGTDGINVLSAASDGWVEIASPLLAVNASLFDFGPVSSLDSASKVLIINNNGNDNLIVSQITIGDSAFSHNTVLPFNIAPGQNQSITLRFNAADGLSHQSVLRIRSNDASSDPKDIILKAESFFPNELLIQDMTSLAGTVDTLYIELFNQSKVAACMADIEYPGILSIKADQVFLTQRSQNHSIQASLINSNQLRIISYSFENLPYSEDKGNLIGIPVTIAPEVSGTYPLKINNLIIGDPEGKSIGTGSKDGLITISTVTDVEMNTGQKQISIYPNPADEVLTIETGYDETSRVTIMSLSGKVLFLSRTFSGSVSLPVGNLSQGLYLIKIESKIKVQYSRFIKSSRQ